MENVKVNVLIDNPLDVWNVPLINHLFEPGDMQAFLRVPIVDVPRGDMRIWDHSSYGGYMMRSAYKLILPKLTNFDMLRMHGDWHLT